MNHTGYRLSAMLDEVGMSKRRLSIESGVAYKTVSRICAGDRLGNLDTWLRFAEVLGCSVSDLIGDGEDER